MKGPNSYEIKQQQDAVRDGLRAVNNAISDKAVVPGAGVFEVALSSHLHEFKKTVDGKKRLGVEAYAEAVLEIPRVIASNAGHDAIDVLVSLQNSADKHLNLGINIENGELIDPKEKGIWDNYCVKKNQLQSAPLVASQLLLVDEILKAGKQLR